MIKNSIYILLFLLLLASIKSKAQQYVPLVVDSSHWFTKLDNAIIGPPPPNNITEYYLLGDTVVTSVNYKKLYIRYGELPLPLSSNFSLCALLREDTLSKKVFTIMFQGGLANCPLNQEVLLFDFDLQIGDTIKNTTSCLFTGPFTVGNILQGNGWIPSSKVFYLNGAESLYEGVGSSLGLFGYIGILANQDFLIDYCRGGITNCVNYTVGIETANRNNNFTVYPNPIFDYFKINSNTEMLFDYSIYTIEGKLIKQGQNRTNTAISTELEKGIYFLQLINEKTQFVKKIIKL